VSGVTKLRAAGLAVILAWGWKRAGIALLAGALSALAMAPFNAWPVLFATLPVVVWLIDGAGGGRLRGVPLETLVERATRSPARVYGIYPQKGTIAVGSDADLVVVDLEQERVVRAEDLQGMSDFSPFQGKRLRGWPVATIKAGRIVARDGKIIGEPQGRYLPRKRRAPPQLTWFH